MTSLSEPRDNSVKVAFNAKFPKTPSYQNPLDGILHHKMDISFNFVMRDDTASQYPCTDLKLEEARLPIGSSVRRIRIREFNEGWHPDMFGNLERKTKPSTVTAKKFRSIVALHGIELFDANDKCLCAAGFFGNQKAHTRDYLLDENERIIGIFSRIEQRYETQAIHRDFQFLIGKPIVE